ncbi:class I glutamine amidotransferase-like protein [Plectosphaerella cucumerina]|uniref:Class I glutamine amidotransferase-like protein n=1 Tax=Plectosphaerella cucumerina TaxID=40658 RepID=A0A8K0X2V6_9PEZI|nr:class I glutamine amidotransferase-like protein [Plectosphaerella cucumerina]
MACRTWLLVVTHLLLLATAHAQNSTCSGSLMTLSIIAAEPGPVSAVYPPHVMVPGMPPLDFSHMLDPKITATHSFADAPDLDILLVPGGMGNMALDQANDTSVEDFVAQRYPELENLLSVCTGAASLAKSGVLKGKRATTNKAQWGWVTSHMDELWGGLW